LRVTNTEGLFAEATLTVTVNGLSLLQVTANPSGQMVCSGNPVSFTAAATGSTGVQWQLSTDGGMSFNNINGANNTTYTINSVSSSQNGARYRAVFSNGCTTMMSNAASLMVNTGPMVTSNASDQTTCAGGNVTFSAAASGSPTPAVQWQLSTNGGTSFTNISGATSTTLPVNSVTASQNGYKYQAVFTNTCGSAMTGATLKVNTGPVVMTNPTGQTSVAGGSVTFTAAATGSPSPTVQWQVSTNGGATFTNINGATSTSLSFTPTPSQSGNRYRAVFMNTCGSVPTSAATLTVYDICMKDDSAANLFQFNSVTGEYRLISCPTGWMLTGTGAVRNVSGVLTVTDSKPDRRVNAGFNPGQKTGTATINFQATQGVWQTFRINSTNPSAVCACTG